ncbi:MAG TPA: hypothetical protein VKI44_19800 [Acetobacteraceae bacterium]|nr:hypothetical protein [Acetobacteraceae bacterium]
MSELYDTDIVTWSERHAALLRRRAAGDNQVSLGFVESRNNIIRVFQRRAHRLKRQEYLRLKVLSRMLAVLRHATIIRSIS